MTSPASEDGMAQVTMYSKMLCPFCSRAKKLLKEKGVEQMEEIDITMSSKRRSEMMERAGGAHTVPQIFIGTTHVGGCDELYEMDRQGKLDGLLAGQA
jgi:glutaredoxin 3